MLLRSRDILLHGDDKRQEDTTISGDAPEGLSMQVNCLVALPQGAELAVRNVFRTWRELRMPSTKSSGGQHNFEQAHLTRDNVYEDAPSLNFY